MSEQNLNRVFYIPEEPAVIDNYHYEQFYLPSINTVLAKLERPLIKKEEPILRITIDISRDARDFEAMIDTLKDFNGVLMLQFHVPRTRHNFENPRELEGMKWHANYNQMLSHILDRLNGTKAKAILWHGLPNFESLTFRAIAALARETTPAVVVRINDYKGEAGE